MELAFFSLCNVFFYTFLYFILYHFDFFAQLNSSIILFVISFIICSLAFFAFGTQILSFLRISSGISNYIIYLYKYLFMFSPLLSLFFVSLHKCFAQKKQLIFLIALKYIFPIILTFTFMRIVDFSKLLWLISITDFCTTIFSIYFSYYKN